MGMVSVAMIVEAEAGRNVFDLDREAPGFQNGDENKG
jgi:hypothetical protein